MRIRRKKIGLALGSGGARGWSHVGVVEAVRELGIPIHCVAGTSMGAVVGSAFAADKIDALHQAALELDWRHFAYYFLEVSLPRAGLIDGGRIVKFLKQRIISANIEDLAIPFAAVATDIFSGDEVVFREGCVINAVRASIAIPGIFTPLVTKDHVLVDGGLVNPLPVSVARDMGANFVIAVDILRPPQSAVAESKRASPPPSDGMKSKEASPPQTPNFAKADWLRRANEKIREFDFSSLPVSRKWFAKSDGPNMFDVLG